MRVNQENMKKLLMNIYEESAERVKERSDIIRFYSIYGGKAEIDELIGNPLYEGQSWEVPDNLDFNPSQDIRNHIKKLILKQGRFFLGESPSVLFKPFNKEQRDAAEAKRMFIDELLEQTEFWAETYKAFIDCTVGKRVLMAIIANPGEELAVRYYRSDCFSYKTDPLNYKQITEVIIAFQDEATIGNKLEDEIWYKYKYYMGKTTAILEKSTWDGNGEEVQAPTIFDTGFDRIPCRVILNGGLLGDGLGTSDVEDLIDLAFAYNRTFSDFRDALRFKMFEQPVLINASEESVDSIKIAPNALIDLKVDPANPDKNADAKMLSSTFSFQEATKIFLDATKGDMYEIMDQPLPEDIRNVPSAKAIKFVFYDLIARCSEKWKSWMPAVLWGIDFMLQATEKLKLYQDLPGREALLTEGKVILNPRYPLPEDEEVTKGIAMKEVEMQVRSHKSYIRDFSDAEDEDGEFQEIIEETKEIQEATKPAEPAMDIDGQFGGGKPGEKKPGKGTEGGKPEKGGKGGTK